MPLKLFNYRGDIIDPELRLMNALRHTKQFDPVTNAAIIQAIGSGLMSAFAPDAPEQKESRVTEQEKRVMRISAQFNKIRQGRRSRERGPLVENGAKLLSTPGVDPEQAINAKSQLAKGQDMSGQSLHGQSQSNQSQPSRPQFTTSQPGTRRHNNPSRFVGATNRGDQLRAGDESADRQEFPDLQAGATKPANAAGANNEQRVRQGQGPISAGDPDLSQTGGVRGTGDRFTRITAAGQQDGVEGIIGQFNKERGLDKQEGRQPTGVVKEGQVDLSQTGGVRGTGSSETRIRRAFAQDGLSGAMEQVRLEDDLDEQGGQ